MIELILMSFTNLFLLFNQLKSQKPIKKKLILNTLIVNYYSIRIIIKLLKIRIFHLKKFELY